MKKMKRSPRNVSGANFFGEVIQRENSSLIVQTARNSQVTPIVASLHDHHSVIARKNIRNVVTHFLFGCFCGRYLRSRSGETY